MTLLTILLLACADPAPAAFADLHSAVGTTTRVTVRGRVLRAREPSDLPRAQASQDELDRAELTLALVGPDGVAVTSRAARASEEGMLDVPLDFPVVAEGVWSVVASRNGQEIGRSTARLLAPGHVEPVVRSDIDLTYLVTDFHSKAGMLALLSAGAKDRTALAGMPAVYRALQGASEQRWRPVTFLSGSPTFFKQTLEGRMALDGIRPSLVVLKPMKELVGGGEVPLDRLVATLEEQIGYKLYWLLLLRPEIPAETPEILMGDDSEADFVVYNLYHRLTAGELDLAGLMTALDEAQVAAVWKDEIARVAPAALAHLGGRAPVRAIYIHDTGKPGSIPLAPWVVPGLTRVHGSAWSLALDLAEEGWIAAEDVEKVRAALLASGETEAALQAEAQAATAAGWLGAVAPAEAAGPDQPAATPAPR